jgi:ferritin-like metal-binding protein YciE
MKNASLHDLFIVEVQDLYSAEQQILKALPKMIKAATDEDLKAGFEDHLSETEEQAARLEQIAEDLEFKVKGKACQGMAGIVKEGEEAVAELEKGPIRDLGLIGAAQRVEHYEIAGYGTARALAEAMGHNDAADLLEETADEEGETDQKLTDIAEEIMSGLDDSDGENEDTEIED